MEKPSRTSSRGSTAGSTFPPGPAEAPQDWASVPRAGRPSASAAQRSPCLTRRARTSLRAKGPARRSGSVGKRCHTEHGCTWLSLTAGTDGACRPDPHRWLCLHKPPCRRLQPLCHRCGTFGEHPSAQAQALPLRHQAWKHPASTALPKPGGTTSSPRHPCPAGKPFC